jgi:hypothetical protein
MLMSLARGLSLKRCWIAKLKARAHQKRTL